MTDILSLLEAATEGSRELDWRIAWWLGHSSMKNARDDFFPPFVPGSRSDELIPHYTTNLQDAVSLVPEGSYMKMTLARDHKTAWVWIERAEDEAIGYGPPALAVCQAIIKASKAEAA